MQSSLRTLTITHSVGDSIVGTSSWGPRFESVSVGRAVPCLKKTEDAEAILRCGFLDSDTPIELNLASTEAMRSLFQQKRLIDSDVSGRLDPESLIRAHPLIGYLSPELFTAPNAAGLRALAGSSVTCGEVARLRLDDHFRALAELDWSEIGSEDVLPDWKFWEMVAKSGSYPRLIGDLLARGSTLRIALIAPPVPAIHEDWMRSADLQFELNAAASALLKPPSGGTPSVRPLYSLYAHPSSLREPRLLHRSLDHLRLALAGSEYGFMGVHLSFIDLEAVGREGAMAVRTTKDFVAKVIDIASQSGRFTVVSDTGPIGPAFLDLGAAFTTHGLNMTLHRTYPIVRPPKKRTRAVKKRVQESKYGKVLGGPWNYVLLRYRDLRDLAWKLEDPNGKFINEVPPSLRGGPDDRFRVDFSKPYNASVQEVLNDLRDRELIVNKNARPGRSILGRSEDSTIAPWA